MKNLIFILTSLLLSTEIFAQVPQYMKYQAVARDAAGVVLANKNVAFKISILKGSVTGTSMYSEQHKKTTNAFGLVDLEIGNGSSPSGSISSINWGDGTYFIKVEMDPEGGTSFALMGTSQLLSVPYALYSKTSETASDAVKLIGDQTIEGDKTFKGTISAGDNRITHVGNPLGSKNAANKAYVDSVFSSINQSVDESYVDSVFSSQKHLIGEHYGDGIIFFVYDKGQHGLIASFSDQSTSIQWNNGVDKFTGAQGDGLDAGELNTALIVSRQIVDEPMGNFAAKLCANYESSNFGDWYLPSLYELSLLYLQKKVVGGFTDGFYFSSTENDVLPNNVSIVKFLDGTLWNGGKSSKYCVRAIRAF
jgi:hypothetical protein